MAGGSGVIAAQNVVRSAPDGYTVFITSNTTHASNQSLLKKVPYDAVTDFEPVTKLGTITLALVAHPSVAGEGRQGTDRLCQSQSRQADVRLRLDVIAGRGRASQNRRRHRHAACALQEQSAGRDRFAGRADFAVLRRRLDLDAAGRGRQAERLRGVRAEALAARARSADARTKPAFPVTISPPGSRRSCRPRRRSP